MRDEEDNHLSVPFLSQSGAEYGVGVGLADVLKNFFLNKDILFLF